jgi:hypothetical protein
MLAAGKTSLYYAAIAHPGFEDIGLPTPTP